MAVQQPKITTCRVCGWRTECWYYKRQSWYCKGCLPAAKLRHAEYMKLYYEKNRRCVEMQRCRKYINPFWITVLANWPYEGAPLETLIKHIAKERMEKP